MFLSVWHSLGGVTNTNFENFPRNGEKLGKLAKMMVLSVFRKYLIFRAFS